MTHAKAVVLKVGWYVQHLLIETRPNDWELGAEFEIVKEDA